MSATECHHERHHTDRPGNRLGVSGARHCATSVALRAALVVGALVFGAATVGCGTTAGTGGGGGAGGAGGGAGSLAPTALDGRWNVATVNVDNEATSVPSGVATEVHLAFTRDPSGTGITELTGHGGVNRLFGTAKVGADGSLSIDGLGTTRMAGPPGMMAFEGRLMAALRGVTSWRGEGTGVILSGPGTKIWLLPASTN